jgi:Ser/Thr protein kinase RdoA (MazF antagonist)
MTGTTTLADARRRIAPRPARDRIIEHLDLAHGLRISALSQLDLGVYRADRTEGPALVVRVFPALRPHAAVAGDAEILELLADSDFSSERIAAPEPLSVLYGQSVLVTEYVESVPRSERRDAIRAAGGLRRLGEMLGQLHALPVHGGAAARTGGGWHHLVDGSPQDEIEAARALLADCADRVPAGGERAYQSLRQELSELDSGAGLPQALTHPDFVLANVVAEPGGGMVVVDWAGAGRGPRAWSLAFLLWAEGAKNLARVDLVAAGYRRHVQLEPEELRRLPAMLGARPAVLAAWSFCLGRLSLADAARTAAEARSVAGAAGPRAVAALASPAA